MKLTVLIRPQWSTVLFTLLTVVLALAAVELKAYGEGVPVKRLLMLGLAGGLYVFWFLVFWIPERSRLAGLIVRLCNAEY